MQREEKERFTVLYSSWKDIYISSISNNFAMPPSGYLHAMQTPLSAPSLMIYQWRPCLQTIYLLPPNSLTYQTTSALARLTSQRLFIPPYQYITSHVCTSTNHLSVFCSEQVETELFFPMFSAAETHEVWLLPTLRGRYIQEKGAEAIDTSERDIC